MNGLQTGIAFPIINNRFVATPRARGEMYGRLAKGQVAQSLATYSRLFSSCGINWAEATHRATAYRDCIQWLDPTFIEEMEGIAIGAEVQFVDILTLNCRTEILPSSVFSGSGECTSIAVSPKGSADGHSWLAQNWDWLGAQRTALVVLQTRDSHETPIVTLTEAGMLAKIGLNARGMAVGLNILRTVDDGLRPGVPVHVLLRHALAHESLSAFRKRLATIMDNVGFGAGSNIPAADALGNVACFELSPAGWAEHPSQDGVVVHTNHYLCSPLSMKQAELGPTLSTESRLTCASAHAAQRPIRVATLEALLRDESDGLISICRRPDPALADVARLESVAGIRIDCTARRWWIAPNIPSKVHFDEVQTGFEEQIFSVANL